MYARENAWFVKQAKLFISSRIRSRRHEFNKKKRMEILLM